MNEKEQWLIDLDGVLWLGAEPIAGSAEALERFRASGRRVAFFTNNSFPSREELLKKFAKFSVACDPSELLSSPEAAASLCAAGERALVLGGPGIRQALEGRGLEVQRAQNASGDEGFDVVVVGFDPEFDFGRLRAATRAVRGGARLIGTNDDATYPMADGPVPGGGSMLAAVSYASGATPVVAGKPHPAAAELVAARLGKVAVVVGDRLSTDGELASRVGARFALVLSGVTTAKDRPFHPKPDLEAENLALLVDTVLTRDS